MLLCDVSQRGKFSNAGVGENNIDSPLHLSDGLVETIKVGQSGNVITGRRRKELDEAVKAIGSNVSGVQGEYIRTLPGEQLRRSQPDSFGAACDESDLVFKLLWHCFFSAVAE